MTNEELGKHLARELFKVGDLGADHCHRIEFKGGDWRGGRETALGGLAEAPLAKWLTEALDRAALNGPEQP